MQRYEGKLEPQSLALSSGRRCLADTNLHQVSANHEFARETLARGEQLFPRGIAGNNVAEHQLLDACRFRYSSDVFNPRVGVE